MVFGWFGFQTALFIGGLLLITWEVGENADLLAWIGCVSESTENYVMDIVIGTIGLCLGFTWMFGRK